MYSYRQFYVECSHQIFFQFSHFFSFKYLFQPILINNWVFLINSFLKHFHEYVNPHISDVGMNRSWSSLVIIRRWTTRSAQLSNKYGALSCMCCIKVLVGHHNWADTVVHLLLLPRAFHGLFCQLLHSCQCTSCIYF